MDLSEDAGGGGWGGQCDPQPNAQFMMATETGKRTWSAFLFGAWAVHRSPQLVGFARIDPDSWQVSYVPTGQALGIAAEFGFWDAIRIARALEDTELLSSGDLSEIDEDVCCIFEAAVGAALHDHYVWPIYAITEEVCDGQISL